MCALRCESKNNSEENNVFETYKDNYGNFGYNPIGVPIVGY